MSNPPPLRVALLAATCVPWHPFGGLERHVFELARWLRRSGVEVDLFTSPPERAADPFAGDAGFRHEVVPGIPFLRRRNLVIVTRSTLYPLYSLRMGRALARAAATRGYAAVIAQGLTAFGAGFWLERLRIPLPVVMNPQGMEESITPSTLKRLAYWPLRVLARRGARRASVVIATDEVLAEPVERVLGVAHDRLAVIPNPIDAELCRAQASIERRQRLLAELGCADAAPIVVTVGRLAPNKGLAVALEAFATISPELPTAWRWILVGEGAERGPLERRAAELGLGGQVVFAGRRDDADMHSLLAGADLFLNPTLYEGSSLTTLEAMAHGRPIVATRAGGIPDKILDGETGWLVEPGDPASAARGILRWWHADPATRDRLGAAARARVAARFDWPVAIGRYLTLVRSLLSRSQVPS